MKKKLMVVAPYFYPKIGGMENYAWNISRGLKEKYGWDVVVITSNHEEKKYKEEIIKGIKIYRLPIMFKISNTPINPLWLFSIKKIIKKEKPDIINAHTPVPFISDITARIKNRIPFVLTYQNDLVKESKVLNFVCKSYYLLFGNKTINLSDKIIVSSELYAKTSPYLKKYKDKVEVVYPGVFVNNRNSTKENIKNKNGEKIVLFVGQLDKTHTHKGLNYLIEAVAITSKKINNIKLKIIGKGDYIYYYQKLTKELNIEKHVEFLGFLTDKKLSDYYKSCDVVVLPSTNNSEGFGMVLIEAMACGKPVIGARVGGIPYVIDDKVNGLLVEPKKPQALADAIMKILSAEKLARRMGENGYKKVSENFTWDKQVIKTYHLIYPLNEHKKNTIVHVTPYYPPHLGGMENVVKVLSEMCYSRGYKVEIYTSNIGINNKKIKVNNKLIVNYLNSLEIAHTPIIFSLFFKLLSISKNSIVHLHISTALTPEIVFLISKLRKMPYIAHIHLDVDRSGTFGFLLSPYKRFFLKRVLQNASKIICLSENQKKIISNMYGIQKDKIVIIHNGVNEAYYLKRDIKKKINPTILFVGRLVNQKNIPILIKAMSLLSCKAKLKIVGEGVERKNIEKLISDLKLNNIYLEGKKTGNELLKFYNESDIFVLTSKKEGVPLALLEAMASGLPIVASNIPSISEIINGCSILVEKITPDKFASALDTLIKDVNLQRQLSKLAYSKANNYKWTKSIDDLENVYNEFI